MKNYFKGNTRARRVRMAKIHKKFLAHQRKWMARSLARNILLNKWR